MIVDDLHERIGDARVIDVMRAVPAAAAVETPAVVDFADAQHFSVCSASRLDVRDLIAGVLRDLVSFFEGNGGEAAFTVYRRRFNC